MASHLTSRDVRRAVFPRVLVANLVAATLTAAAIELAEPADAQEGMSLATRLLGSIAAAGALALVLALIALRQWRDREAELWMWLDEARAPTPAELDRVLAEPWRGARELLRYWLIGAVFVGLLFLINEGLGRTVPAAIGATALGGATATALSFFLAEGASRPALVRALAGQPSGTTSALGARRRILLAWALGSGVPMAWIAFVPVFRDPSSSVPVVFLTTLLAVTGLAAGVAIASLVGASVGGPVEQVRQGMQRVERGDLDVRVSVDDVGELGILEAGFNNMVKAVSEREVLRDLFGRHVGEEVARRVLERGIDLDGEVREVSALFVDIVGSTELATRLPATEVVALLNRFFAVVVEAVAGEGGWVNKFEGDGALCVFGAPEPQRDHAAQSLRAARVLQRALGDVDVVAGIGVSAGLAVAGNVGAETRLEYTIIGHPVNEAARLVEHAKRRPALVLASAAVVSLAGTPEAGWWSDAGSVELRGIATPMQVFEPRRTGP